MFKNRVKFRYIMRQKIERNIFLIYLTSSLGWGRFFIPVMALFYIASQVPLEQFTLIMSVFFLARFLFEVPTGVLADLLGKKKTMLLSRGCYIIEIILLAFFNGFWPFLIAKVISGIGVSLSSGTEQALMYDTLKRLKRENEHKKISGTLKAITGTTQAFVFIIGGFLFTINPKLTAIASLPFIILSFIFSLFFIEPYESKRNLSLGNSLLQLKEGLYYFANHGYIRYVTLFSLPISATIAVFLSVSSAYFAAVAIPISIIGILAFISAMSGAIMSKKAHSIEEKLGEKRSIMLSQFMPTIGVFLMALMLPYIGALFYYLIPITQGFFEIITNDYMNKHVESSHRATMLSIRSLFDDLGTFVAFPFIGYLTKLYSMQTSFLFSGIVIVVYLAVLALFSKKILGNHQLQ